MNNRLINVEDATIRLARQALRQVNLASFSMMAERLLAKAGAERTAPEDKAKYKLLAAEMRRAAGEERRALELASEVANNPPMNASGILAAAQRLQVALLLDGGEIGPATRIASEIDALVINSGQSFGSNGTDGEILINRHTADISVETFLTEAEVAICGGGTEQALENLERGYDRLVKEESATSAGRLRAFEMARATARFNDLRAELRFWGAVCQLRTGDLTAYETLQTLAESLLGDPASDKRLVARIRAVQGEFDINAGVPPAGISIREARRLWKLTTDEFLNGATGEINEHGDHADLIPVNVAAGGPNVAKNNNAAATLPSEITAGRPPHEIEDKFVLLLDKFSRVLDQLPAAGSGNNGKSGRRPFAFGGGFDFLNICTLLEQGEENRSTGFFLVQWNPDLVETSILAGNLASSARAGEGFIFMRDGVVIDACLGNYDPPPEFAAGTAEAERDARRSLKILIQIGTAKKLDREPEGSGEFYNSAAVKHRPVRFEFEPSALFNLVIEMDEELQEAE